MISIFSIVYLALCLVSTLYNANILLNLQQRTLNFALPLNRNILIIGCNTMDCGQRLCGRNSQASGGKSWSHQTRATHQKQNCSWQTAASPYACECFDCSVVKVSIVYILSTYLVSFIFVILYNLGTFRRNN